MNNDSLKWLMLGLVGAVCSMVLIVGGAGAIFYFYVLEDYEDYEVVSGEEEWAEEEAEFNKEAEETEAEIARLGLDKLYELVYYYDDTRNELYENKNYQTVEERLTTRRAEADTPLKKHYYSQYISHLAEIEYNEKPDELLATLDAWVEHSPDTHLPWLVRGAFQLELASYYRGSAWGYEVDDDGMEKYQRYNVLGRDDLLKAVELEPNDPESYAALIDATAGTGEGIKTMRKYYEKTLALNPLHLNVRWSMLHFSQPRWYGDWEMMDTLMEEAERASSEFPMLMGVYRLGLWDMTDRDPKYDKRWNSDSSGKKWASAYAAQALQTPDDLHVLADAAYYAGHAKDYVAAANYFLKLGNRYPTGSEYDDLPSFHEWRVFTLAVTARDSEVIGTPQEREFLDALASCAAKDSSYYDIYLAYLVRQRDDEQTKAFYADYRGGYLNTGSWGDPPNYDVMDAMARAGESDEYGTKDTEREIAMLQEALSLAPENAYVRLVFAEYHITSKEYDEARIHLEKAREIDPDYLPAIHIMGWLNYHQKRWDEGIAFANQFLESGPSEYLTTYAEDAREIIELCEEKKAG